MVVVILTAAPVGLRGQLTRWLLEVAPGVFVGYLPARVRDLLWARITGELEAGKALMIYSRPGEQRLAFRASGHEWIPEDHEGIYLMRRPPTPGHTVPKQPPEHWSIAARRRRFRGGTVPRRSPRPDDQAE
ncbi:MAG: type I-E CRISPR-associated endoribonuclease Cas2e [Kineosporiaceae bacterium]